MKNLYRLLHEITSKGNNDCYCINCLHSVRTESTLKPHENVWKNHNYCNIQMHEACKKILYLSLVKFTQNHNSTRIPFFADTESLLKKCLHVITIQINCFHKKNKKDYVHTVHLIRKTNTISAETSTL